MDHTRITERTRDFVEAAGALADARVEYASQWQVSRYSSKSDWEATQKTIEVTNDDITRLQAAEYVARKELERAYAESKESF